MTYRAETGKKYCLCTITIEEIGLKPIQIPKTMRIKCPHCGNILLVKQQISNPRIIITCPVCKEQSPLALFKIIDSQMQNNVQPQGNNSDSTKYQGGGYDHTQYHDNSNERTELNTHSGIGSFAELSSSGTTHQLKMGKNIIGRKWSGNTITDIAIDTPGKNRMSREHLVVEVKDVPGKGIVHYASLYKQNVNKTFINKEKLDFGDRFVLNNGDIIELPDASIKFILNN